MTLAVGILVGIVVGAGAALAWLLWLFKDVMP